MPMHGFSFVFGCFPFLFCLIVGLLLVAWSCVVRCMGVVADLFFALAVAGYLACHLGR